MSFCNDSHWNLLLDALPDSECQRSLELVQLRAHQLLADADTTVRDAYFPTTAVISLSQSLEDGISVEVASVGREGMVGWPLMTGGNSMPTRVEVQSGGFAYRVHSNEFRYLVSHSPILSIVLLRYLQALFIQIAQTAICYRYHTVRNQVARWLLLSFDRGEGLGLSTTHELISDALGVRREVVTQTICELHLAGTIRRSRRRIELVDRAELLAAACECYSVTSSEFDRLESDLHRRLSPSNMGELTGVL